MNALVKKESFGIVPVQARERLEVRDRGGGIACWIGEMHVLYNLPVTTNNACGAHCIVCSHSNGHADVLAFLSCPAYLLGWRYQQRGAEWFRSMIARYAHRAAEWFRSMIARYAHRAAGDGCLADQQLCSLEQLSRRSYINRIVCFPLVTFTMIGI